MTINLDMPEIRELKPKITVFGVGGAGGNAVNNMINSGLQGCDFVVANTDSQALASSSAERVIQMGVAVTEGLGAGSQPEIGQAAAEEAIDEIKDHLGGSHMVFVTAGMGGGTGTGAAPVIARTARDAGILTVGVVTKPFQFEGGRRMRVADSGIETLQEHVDTLIVIPNQNLFRVANEKTTFADAFAMADQVLYSGVACITDLMVKEGLINLDFADVRSVMREMGKAMMGTGEASGDSRATQAAEAAIANPLLDETSMKGAKGLLISITGGRDLTLYEVDEAATRIREEVDPDANIILGATFEESLEGVIRVSVVATGIERLAEEIVGEDPRITQMTDRLRAAVAAPRATPMPAAPAAIDTRPQPQPAAQATAQQATAPQQTTETAQAAEADEEATPDPVEGKQADVAQLRPAAAQAPRPAEAQPATPAPQPRPAAAQAASAVAAAVSDPDVTIGPYQSGALHQQPADHLDEVQSPPEVVHPSVHEPFVPPTPEAPQSRMPQPRDFPPIARQQMAAQEPQQPSGDAEDDHGPLGLLKRLATVGLGRREDAPLGAHHEPRAPQPAPASRPAVQAPQKRAIEPRSAPQPVQQAPQHAPQAAFKQEQGNLDGQGRAQAHQPRPLDDELEIPAFLRRQAN